MINRIFRACTIRWVVLAVAVVLGFGFGTGSVMGADRIDPDADKLLRSMSTYLGGLSAFSVNADVDTEIVDLAGQKLQLSSSGTINIERPGKFYAHRRGPFADMELISDGKTLTLNEKKRDVYWQTKSSGTIEGDIRTIRVETGLDAPAGDLFYADPYSGLVTDVMSGAHLGTAYVNGVECHHLAFRAAKVDWQLWIRTGDTPLPMKYVITSKWVTGGPQYAVRFRGWNTKQQIMAGRFAFLPPQGARRLDTIPVNEIGELMLEEVK